MEKTWIRKIYADDGLYKFFVRREGYGGPILSVTEVRFADTNQEVQIPLEIKDNDLLENYLKAVKGRRGVEGN